MSAVLYHISPATGKPNRCTASKRECPLGAETGHYASKEEAQVAYEAQQKGSELPSVAKKESGVDDITYGDSAINEERLQTAQLDLLDAEDAFLNTEHPDRESFEDANDAYEAARNEVRDVSDVLAIRLVRHDMILTDKAGPKGPYASVLNPTGREVGTVVPSNGEFSLMAYRPSRVEEYVGAFPTEEAALQALAASIRHSFRY